MLKKEICRLDKKYRIHLPEKVWEVLGKQGVVTATAYETLDYVQIYLQPLNTVFLESELSVIDSEGNLELDGTAVKRDLATFFPGMCFFYTPEGKGVKLELFKPYCQRCGEIEGLVNHSKDKEHDFYLCQSCLSAITQEPKREANL